MALQRGPRLCPTDFRWVGKILDALRDIAEIVGFDHVNTDVSRHPKVRLDSTFVSGGRMRIKIELNTYERSPARPIISKPFGVDSPWFTGNAKVLTYALEELAATKIRALFQRKKGRDMFDLWLAVKQGGVSPTGIAACFGPYRPVGWTPARAVTNLEAKLEDREFAADIDRLVLDKPHDYSMSEAAQFARAIFDEIERQS